MALLLALTAVTARAQDSTADLMTNIFSKAEQCYLNDDYNNLLPYIKLFDDLLTKNRKELGDSLDVFEAYLYKMRGAYYYGITSGNDLLSEISEDYYLRSMEVFMERNSMANVLTLREELAQLYYKCHDYTNAMEQLETVYGEYDRMLNDMGIESAEPQYYKTVTQKAICDARLGNFDEALSQIDEALSYYKKRKDGDYFETLRKKGKILMIRNDSLGNGSTKEAAKVYGQYVTEQKATLGKRLEPMSLSQRHQYWLAIHQFLYDCFRLGNDAPEMLYDLTLFSKGYLLEYNKGNTPPETTWRNIRSALGDKECAVEFVEYFGKNDQRRLGCLFLDRRSKKPLFIDLFATDSVLRRKMGPYIDVGDVISSTSLTMKDSVYNDKELSSLVWSPALMKAIGKADKVYFAPDGLIHQWAVEYVMPDTTKTCYRLSSTRNILMKNETVALNSALLIGGADFNTSVSPVMRDNDEIAYEYLYEKGYRSFTDLPQSRKEVQEIKEMRNNPNDTVLVNDLATDENFQRLLEKGFDIVHVSSHGYYQGNLVTGNDIKPMLNNYTMSQCGLVFTGAGSTLSDYFFDENLYDGILSAEELSMMDFSHARLTILNTCQSGVGQITADGVNGVQRALKEAGANAMLVTLWSVYDKPSRTLMTYFYEELDKQKRKSIHQAFMKARQRLKDYEYEAIEWDYITFTYKKVKKKFERPLYMDPFILIDAF